LGLLISLKQSKQGVYALFSFSSIFNKGRKQPGIFWSTKIRNPLHQTLSASWRNSQTLADLAMISSSKMNKTADGFF
jgi:hypothetical protein